MTDIIAFVHPMDSLLSQSPTGSSALLVVRMLSAGPLIDEYEGNLSMALVFRGSNSRTQVHEPRGRSQGLRFDGCRPNMKAATNRIRKRGSPSPRPRLRPSDGADEDPEDCGTDVGGGELKVAWFRSEADDIIVDGVAVRVDKPDVEADGTRLNGNGLKLDGDEGPESVRGGWFGRDKAGVNGSGDCAVGRVVETGAISNLYEPIVSSCPPFVIVETGIGEYGSIPVVDGKVELSPSGLLWTEVRVEDSSLDEKLGGVIYIYHRDITVVVFWSEQDNRQAAFC